ALACLPALAYLSLSLPDRIFGDEAILASGMTMSSLNDTFLKHDLQTLRMLSNGFIVTGLLWAWMLAAMIDRQLKLAGIVMLVGAALTIFGIIHSPIAGNRMFMPWMIDGEGNFALPGEYFLDVIEFAVGYFLTGIILIAWSAWLGTQSDEDALVSNADSEPVDE
ncbi:MAG: permease, partial [Planctomycetota bacterium]